MRRRPSTVPVIVCTSCSVARQCVGLQQRYLQAGHVHTSETSDPNHAHPLRTAPRRNPVNAHLSVVPLGTRSPVRCPHFSCTATFYLTAAAHIVAEHVMQPPQPPSHHRSALVVHATWPGMGAINRPCPVHATPAGIYDLQQHVHRVRSLQEPSPQHHQRSHFVKPCGVQVLCATVLDVGCIP
jgi:hypothetical protein